jgi:hypothetical protein
MQPKATMFNMESKQPVQRDMVAVDALKRQESNRVAANAAERSRSRHRTRRVYIDGYRSPKNAKSRRVEAKNIDERGNVASGKRVRSTSARVAEFCRNASAGSSENGDGEDMFSKARSLVTQFFWDEGLNNRITSFPEVPSIPDELAPRGGCADDESPAVKGRSQRAERVRRKQTTVQRSVFDDDKSHSASLRSTRRGVSVFSPRLKLYPGRMISVGGKRRAPGGCDGGATAEPFVLNQGELPSLSRNYLCCHQGDVPAAQDSTVSPQQRYCGRGGASPIRDCSAQEATFLHGSSFQLSLGGVFTASGVVHFAPN